MGRPLSVCLLLALVGIRRIDLDGDEGHLVIQKILIRGTLQKTPALLAWLLLTLSSCGEEITNELCGDSIDNDNNGFVDCLDSACLHTGGCDFAPCVDGNDCQGSLCLTEPDNGFPAGSCSSFCQLDAPDCPFGPDSACVDIGLDDGRGICVDTCNNSNQCREEMSCRDGNVGVFLCLPNCAIDADCPLTGHCNQDNGFCESTPEICDNITDDDGDSRSDCDDADCIGGPDCDPFTACQQAPSIVAGTLSDTTEDGTNFFVGACAGDTAREKFFSFIPDTKAALRATLSSPSVHGVYAFVGCNLADEIGCISTFSQDPNVLIIPAGEVSVGVPVLFVVDGFLNGQEGPFSLTVEVVPSEINCEDLFDEDFDGDIDCQDSDCAAACTPGAGALGAPCTTPSDCQLISDAPACIDEIFAGFPSGYCTGFCDADADCGANNFCRNGLCRLGCVDASGCTTPGYQCANNSGEDVCTPSCTNDAECAEAGFCDSDIGFCKQVTEDCDNFIDDDGDTLEDCQDLVCQQTISACNESQNCSDGLDNDADQVIDCEDPACLADANCQIAALCAGATPLSGVFSGDTTNSSQQFAGSCTGTNLAHEQIFSVIPGVTGQTGDLTITLDSATDQGFYVRLTCEDPATEVACQDALEGGSTEGLILTGVPGDLPLTIFVDGFQSPDEGGPFTLTVLYTPE
jgi:hypothetical protein